MSESRSSCRLSRRAFQALALGMAAGQARAAPELPRLHGFTENLAPLNYLDESTGIASGFSVDLLRLIADEAGLPYEVEVMPWLRAVQSAGQTSASLLFSLTRTVERENQYQWLGPISPRRILIYRLSSRSDVRPTSLQQLNGCRLEIGRAHV